MANNIGRVMLFGVNIAVTTSDSKGGAGITHCLPQETYVQEHDQKVATHVDDNVGTSTSRFSLVDDDDVDTTLKLSTSVSRSPDPLVKLSTTAVARNSDAPVYCPAPLRCYIPPGIIPGADFWKIFAHDNMDATLNSNYAGSRNSDAKRGKSRKRRQNNVGDDRKKRRKRDNGNADDQNLYPIIPPGLLQTVESRNGTRPVFLYRKKLEKSDASGHLNRLFVNRREKFEQFLSKEEETALNNGLGLEIFGVDSQGKLYKLCLKIWESVETLVVKSGWNKLVNGNDAKRGDWIEMWGYRENEIPCLAINFRKQSEA